MRYTWFIVALIGLGIWLRLWQFGAVPTWLYIDEASIATEALFVAEQGTDSQGNSAWQAIYPSYGDYKQPAYILLTSLFTHLSSKPIVFVRLPNLIVGLASIVLSFYLTKELLTVANVRTTYRQLAALCTAMVVALSPTAIHFSRTGFEAHLGQFLLGMAVYGAVRLGRHTTFAFWKNLCLSVVVALLAAVSVYSYYSTRFVWPVVLLGILALQMISVPSWRIRLKRLGWIVLSGAVFILLVLPASYSEHAQAAQHLRLSTPSVLQDFPQLVQESNELRALAGNTHASRLFYHRYLLFARELATNIAANLSPHTLFLQADTNLRHSTGRHGMFLLPGIILIPFCILALKRKPGICVLLGMWVLSGVLPASVPHAVPHALRSLNTLLPLAICLGLGMAEVIQSSRWVRGIVLASFGIAAIQFSHYYFVIYPDLSLNAWDAPANTLAQALQAPLTEYPELALYSAGNDIESWKWSPDTAWLWLVIQAEHPSTHLEYRNRLTLSDQAPVLIYGSPSSVREYLSEHESPTVRTTPVQSSDALVVVLVENT